MPRLESNWKRQSRWRKTVAVVAFVTGGLLALGLVSMFLDEARVRERGVRVTGEVVDVERNHRSPDYADVRFRTTDGEVAEANVELVAQGRPVHVGDPIAVTYDPDDPTGTAVVAEVHAGWYWLNIAIWFPLLVSIPLMFGAWAGGFSIRRSTPARREHGQLPPEDR